MLVYCIFGRKWINFAEKLNNVSVKLTRIVEK